jgi:hypothetical protein
MSFSKKDKMEEDNGYESPPFHLNSRARGTGVFYFGYV